MKLRKVKEPPEKIQKDVRCLAMNGKNQIQKKEIQISVQFIPVSSYNSMR